jgi:hypothetical protein
MPLEPPTLPFDLPISMPAVRPGIRCARIREPSWCHALGRSSGVRAHSPVPSRIAELVALSAYPTHAKGRARLRRPWRSDPWRCDRPVTAVSRTKGGVRLRATAGVPALLDRTRSSHLVRFVGVAAFGGMEQRLIRLSPGRQSGRPEGPVQDRQRMAAWLAGARDGPGEPRRAGYRRLRRGDRHVGSSWDSSSSPTSRSACD